MISTEANETEFSEGESLTLSKKENCKSRT